VKPSVDKDNKLVMIDDRHSAKYSPRLHADERARMKREDQRLKLEAEERALKDERQRYQNWREVDAAAGKTAEERRLDERKRLGVKDEDWYHREERLKNDERLRYERAAGVKFDSQQLVGMTAHDRCVPCTHRHRQSYSPVFFGVSDRCQVRDAPLNRKCELIILVNRLRTSVSWTL